MNIKIFNLIIILALAKIAFAQSPSPQDCIGAIPVCQSTFNEVNAYSGKGNIIDYIGHRQCDQQAADRIYYYVFEGSSFDKKMLRNRVQLH